MHRFYRSLLQIMVFLPATLGSFAAQAVFVQTNLVSDIAGFATITDPLLKNPWGMSFSPTSPFWISNQGTATSTLYTAAPGTNVTKVNINPPSGFVGIPNTPPGGPTGQVFNPNSANPNPTAFLLNPPNVQPAAPARFIFANLNGSISAWNPAISPGAIAEVTTPGAVYTGLAINTAGTQLYAANVAGGGINVFNSSFAPVSLPGGFTDPNLPAGFVPFNVADIGGKIYVTYAPAGLANMRAATAGMGFVNVFDESGAFLQRLISGSQLASPWGVALAPAGFGEFGGDLLVGNFSFVASEINAFDPVTGEWKGTIPINTGANSPGGLWALAFGNGVSGDANTLFFTDGINGEVNGLFGSIAAVPELSSWAMVVLGFAGVGFMAYHRKSKAALRFA